MKSIQILTIKNLATCVSELIKAVQECKAFQSLLMQMKKKVYPFSVLLCCKEKLACRKV